jgi:hypothetical protein
MIFARPLIKGPQQRDRIHVLSQSLREIHNADGAHRHVQYPIHFGHIAFNQRRSTCSAHRDAQPTNRLQSRKYELIESIPALTVAFTADSPADIVRPIVHPPSAFRVLLSAFKTLRREGEPHLQFEQPTVQRYFRSWDQE